MASTTLVTFLLETPNPMSTVHLLGSWDNFCKAYPMTRDLRIGRRYWHGCFTFSNIICDGEPVEDLVRREGGLKMGGKYWYYYQLDSELDHHNPREPSTTSCPYLPGQLVNVLEVPMQDETDDTTKRPSTSSSSIDAKFTLNPDDKFLALNPPKVLLQAQPIPEMGESQFHTMADAICLPPPKQDDSGASRILFDLPAAPVQPVKSASFGRKASPISAPVSRRPSLWDLFRRDARSADETKMETHQIWQFREYSNKLGTSRLSGQKGKIAVGDTCDTMDAQGCLHEPCQISNLSLTDRSQSCLGSGRPSPNSNTTELRMLAERVPAERADSPNMEQAELGGSMLTLHNHMNRLAIRTIDYAGDTRLLVGTEEMLDTPYSLATVRSQPSAPRNSLQLEAAIYRSPAISYPDREAHESFQLSAIDSSYASSHGLSPTWSSIAFTESFSPRQGAQAVSPTTSDFGECLDGFEGPASFSAHLFTSLEPPIGKHGAGSFEQMEVSESNVYQLPEADESVLTLRDLSKADDPSRHAKPFDAKQGHDLVEAWNDGSQEGVKTTFEEFFDDHSYLSNIIL